MKLRTKVQEALQALDVGADGALYYLLMIVNRKKFLLFSNFLEKERYDARLCLLDKFSMSSVSMATNVYSLQFYVQSNTLSFLCAGSSLGKSRP